MWFSTVDQHDLVVKRSNASGDVPVQAYVSSPRRFSIGPMVSYMQKILALTLLSGAVGWALVCGLRGAWLLAPLGAVGIALGYGLILAAELCTARWVHGTDPAPRARWGQLARAWCGEWVTTPRVFCWQQPFRAQAEPDHVPAAARRGVLLVHGFVCNRGFWNRWMRRLRAQGVPYVAVSLTPMLGSIESYSGALEAAVRRLEAATGLPPVIAAHSMGGLAVRVWLAEGANVGRVHRVITLASPHHGTWLARFGLSQNAREMRQGSALLARLQAVETAATRALFSCFYSHCDNVVFPASTATLPGAENMHLPGVAHVQMVGHPQVWATLQRWLVPR